MSSKRQLEEYRGMLEQKLRPVQAQLQAKMDTLKAQRADLDDVIDKLQAMSTTVTTPYKFLTDIGAGYRMHGRVNDVSSVLVDVGMGLYVEMPTGEGLAFCRARLAALLQDERATRDSLVKVEGDIATVEDTLAQLDALNRS